MVYWLRQQNQDRIDGWTCPVIGPSTVENVVRAGLRGIAVEVERVLVVDSEDDYGGRHRWDLSYWHYATSLVVCNMSGEKKSP